MDECRVVLFAANPAGTKPLALDEEVREIEAKVHSSEYRDNIRLFSKWATRPDDLLQALNQHRPHVVQFSGHGTSNSAITLLDVSGQAIEVSETALVSLFRSLRDNIRLVILNACYSRPQALAITEHIDCAIGMNKAIGDKAAINFVASFYRAIGFGRSIKEAYEQGKTSLQLSGINEDSTPDLIERKGIDAGNVFLVNP